MQKRIITLCLIILTLFSLVACEKEEETFFGTIAIDCLEWKAVADVQELQTFDESSWEPPVGAIVYKTQEEVKSNKVVGYETKYRTEEYQEKVGYYLPTWRPRYETRTRQVAYKEPILEPIYATKYYYTIDRWVSTKSVQLGHGYDASYECKEYACAEGERVNSVEYTYTVWFKVGNHGEGRYVDKELWESLQVGQEIQVERTENHIVDVIWPK